MRLPLLTVVLALASAGFAHAEKPNKVPKGTYGGSELATVDKKIGGTPITYSDSVYSDPSNPFCDGCLDFVIQVDDPGISYGVTSVTTKGFEGYLLSFGYEKEKDDVAPTGESTNKSGNKVTFDLDLFNDDSDPLIIYTDALDFTSGGLTIDKEGTDPPAFAPFGAPYAAPTPEPSSFMLLGSGLLGVVGLVRRRLA